MTEKRYFKREWEECYWIFDSKIVTAKEVDERTQYDNDIYAESMQGEEVINRLNEQHETIQKLELANKRLKERYPVKNEYKVF